jgi:putative aminopeptidase FrvX
MESLINGQESIIDLINWLNSLRSVTDFEEPALSQIHQFCHKYSIPNQINDGGLLIGNPKSHIVLMAHADRIGFVAVRGCIDINEDLELSYIAQLKSIPPATIKNRFSDSLLIGYEPITGEDLFVALLSNDCSPEYHAKIIKVFDMNKRIVDINNPVPMTAVKSQISRFGDYLIGNFDNSAGLALAILMVKTYPEDFSCIITKSEEGGGYLKASSGCRGAKEYIKNHDLQKILVVIDVRPSSLFSNDNNKNCVGKGVVLRKAEFRKDENGEPVLLIEADKKALEYALKVANEKGIEIQTFSGMGITEGGRALEELGSTKPLRCVWFQPPIEYEHSQSEIVSLSDLTTTLTLVESLRHFRD